MINRLILLWVIIIVPSYSYVKTPYHVMQPQTFQISSSYLGHSFDQSASNSYLMTFNGIFRFNDLFFGIHPLMTRSTNGKQGETQFSFGLFLFDSVAIGPMVWSSQIGAYSIGMTDSFKASSFSSNVINYSNSNFVAFNQLPVFMIWTPYFNQSNNLHHSGVIGLQGEDQYLYFEYDGFSKQLYFGVDYRLFYNMRGTMAINMSSNQNLDDSSVFYPTFKLGVSVLDIFDKRKSMKPKKPLPVDEASFTLMEKALIAFNNKNYESAANSYQQVLISYPTFVLAYIRLGNCFFQLKQWEMAKKAWSEALRLDPTNDEVFMALVQLQNREYKTNEFINSEAF